MSHIREMLNNKLFVISTMVWSFFIAAGVVLVVAVFAEASNKIINDKLNVLRAEIVKNQDLIAARNKELDKVHRIVDSLMICSKGEDE